MCKIFFKITVFFTALLFLTSRVSAEVFTRFVTSGTFGSQTNEDTLNKCDGSSLSTYNNAFYDYFTVDNTDLPSIDELVSIDYCIRGRGDINVGFNTEHLASFVGDNSEQCYHATVFDYPNHHENIWFNTGYGLFGGALNTDSFVDCLYVKINTVTPTPTNTPTPPPTNTPTPTRTPTSTPISIPIPTNTLTPTITMTKIRSENPTSTTVSNISAPACNDVKPGSAPVLHLATSSGPNSITLNWTKAKDPVSYYLVTFGTKPGEQLYGNPNVGGPDTNSYTINNLSGGKNYYFKVRAGNGCMPGDFSNEVIGRLIGKPVTDIPDGFVPGVLGESTKTSLKQQPTKSIINTVDDKKMITKSFSKYIFPIIIVIAIIGLTLFFRRKSLNR